jgi:hypothetical protein
LVSFTASPIASSIAFFVSRVQGSIGASGAEAGFEDAAAGDGEGEALTPGVGRNATVIARQEESVSDRFSIPHRNDATVKEKRLHLAKAGRSKPLIPRSMREFVGEA